MVNDLLEQEIELVDMVSNLKEEVVYYVEMVNVNSDVDNVVMLSSNVVAIIV